MARIEYAGAVPGGAWDFTGQQTWTDYGDDTSAEGLVEAEAADAAMAAAYYDDIPIEVATVPAGVDGIDTGITTGAAARAIPAIGGGSPIGTPAIQALIPAATITFSVLSRAVGRTLARQVFQVVGQVAGVARRMRISTAAQWSRLPGWVQTALTSAGVVVGADLIFDDDESAIPGGGKMDMIPGAGSWPAQVGVLGTWQANGVTFYRLTNGYFAVQNKSGRWKTWKPKKPIVLYAGGASNLRTLLKADNAVDRQLKKLDKALRRRRPKTRVVKC